MNGIARLEFELANCKFAAKHLKLLHMIDMNKLRKIDMNRDRCMGRIGWLVLYGVSILVSDLKPNSVYIYIYIYIYSHLQTDLFLSIRTHQYG